MDETHVTAMIGAAEALLSSGSLDDKQREKAQSIRDMALQFRDQYQSVIGKPEPEIIAALTLSLDTLLERIRSDCALYLHSLDDNEQGYAQQILDTVQPIIAWLTGPTDVLVQRILTLGDPDLHETWEPVGILQWRGTRDVFEAARTLCQSQNPRERYWGVSILGQLGIPQRSFPDETFAVLAEMLSKETDDDLLNSIGIAFGHLRDVRAVPLLVPLKSHPNVAVRYGVVSGISGLEDDLAIQTLIELSADDEALIRDWATFGLGSLIETDIPEIRAALYTRMTDEDDVTRGEAIRGLARCHDERVIEWLIKELETSDDPYGLLIGAAQELADSRLYAALLNYRKRVQEGEDWTDENLEAAIAACKPAE